MYRTYFALICLNVLKCMLLFRNWDVSHNIQGSGRQCAEVHVDRLLILDDRLQVLDDKLRVLDECVRGSVNYHIVG